MNETARNLIADAEFAVPDAREQERMVEAVLFASPAPLSGREIAERLPQGSDVAAALAALGRRYAGRGVELRSIGDAWAFRTAPDLGFVMSREVVATRKLSRAAIETLAIVAYHQPVTRAEIEEIRGVSLSGGTLDQLIELGWVKLGRRRLAPGRPMTFVVTPGFLDHFGLESERDLPGIAELRAAGLLDNRPALEPLPNVATDDDEPES
jgi:segregation and condensation protein B